LLSLELFTVFKSKTHSEGKMKSKLFVLYLCSVFLVQPSVVLGQSQQTTPDQAWEPVKRLSTGEKLILESKDGRKIQGRVLSISDQELSISLKQQIATVKREEISKVWRISPPDPDDQRLYAGIGTGAGLMVGLALTISLAQRQCGECKGTKAGVVALLVGLPTAGALIGRKIGSRGERIIIYQAP
jgi:hypothetical protein